MTKKNVFVYCVFYDRIDNNIRGGGWSKVNLTNKIMPDNLQISMDAMQDGLYKMLGSDMIQITSYQYVGREVQEDVL